MMDNVSEEDGQCFRRGWHLQIFKLMLTILEQLVST